MPHFEDHVGVLRFQSGYAAANWEVGTREYAGKSYSERLPKLRRLR